MLVEDIGQEELVWFKYAAEALDEVTRQGDGIKSGLDAAE